MPRGLILVGRIGAAHGVRGDLKIDSFMQQPEALGSLGPLLDVTGRRTFEVRLSRQIKPGRFIGRIGGVDTREDAAALANLELYAGRSSLPAPASDEFYYADLVGLSVEDRAGAKIGIITAVLDFGAGDILQIETAEGGELLLPFTSKAVVAVDLAQGKAIVDPPHETNAQSEGAGGQDG